MDGHDGLAERFEAHRSHLRAVAYRMLGSLGEAEDAVQEAWLRLGRSDAAGIENLGGWLTTAVARVCLDQLRSRRSRREEPLDPDGPGGGPIAERADGADPEREALLAGSVGPALLLVLDTLAPAERLAFVLHDLFAVPFEEIAVVVGRSPAAARQLASRARRRVQGAAPVPGADRARERRVVDAFLAASREGRFDALLELLDPEVVLRADATAVAFGAAAELRGARAVAETFQGRAQVARPAWIGGAAGAAWAPGGQPRVVFAFTLEGDRIVAIDLLADAGRLGELDLEILGS
jgi:RNA polymerase sigma factor (sigma-70 family)